MSIPPAWHPDPTGRHDHRWWDGARWTEHVADAGVAAVDPLEGQGPVDDTSSGAPAPAGDPTSGGGAAADPSGASWASPQGGPAGAGEGQPPWGAGGAGPAGAWGAPQPAGGYDRPMGEPAPQGSDGLAVAALVIGIVSLVTSFFVFGGFGGVVAIVLGAIAMARVRKTGRKGRGMAITGLVTGIVSVIIAIMVVAFFSRFASTFFGDYQECLRETGDEEFCDQQLEEDLERRFFGG